MSEKTCKICNEKLYGNSWYFHEKCKKKKAGPKPRKSKSLCSGCRQNRYNMGKGYQESSRDAVVSCDQCWSYKSATVKLTEHYYSSNVVVPTPKWLLSCFSRG